MSGYYSKVHIFVVLSRFYRALLIKKWADTEVRIKILGKNKNASTLMPRLINTELDGSISSSAQEGRERGKKLQNIFASTTKGIFTP